MKAFPLHAVIHIVNEYDKIPTVGRINGMWPAIHNRNLSTPTGTYLTRCIHVGIYLGNYIYVPKYPGGLGPVATS